MVSGFIPSCFICPSEDVCDGFACLHGRWIVLIGELGVSSSQVHLLQGLEEVAVLNANHVPGYPILVKFPLNHLCLRLKSFYWLSEKL